MKNWMVEQWPDIAHPPGVEVVDANHGIAALDQLVAKMRSDEAGTAGDHGSIAAAD